MSTKSKPTLANPDFSGLWSVARLGHKKRWWSRPVGTISIFCLIHSWILGFLCPLIAILLLCTGRYVIAILLASFLVYPYLFAIQQWPMGCRFWLLGSHYFDGGCTMAFEKDELTSFHPTVQCYHPHGIFTIGYFLNSGVRIGACRDLPESAQLKICGTRLTLDKLGNTTPMIGLGASQIVNAPIFNWFCAKWTGCIQSSSPQNFRRLMSRQINFGVTPGGFYELALFRHNHEFVYIRNVKGFIKYALRYGYRVIPCYTFGESHTYWNLPGFRESRLSLAKKQIPAIFVWGRWFYGLLPKSDIGIHTIHGMGKVFPKIENPSSDEIEEYHQWYMTELRGLFDRHKWRFGMDDTQLEFL